MAGILSSDMTVRTV